MMMRHLRNRIDHNFEDLSILIKFNLREIVEVHGRRYYYYTLVLNHLRAVFDSVNNTNSLSATDLAGDLPAEFLNHISTLKKSILLACNENTNLNKSQVDKMETALTQLINELCSDIQLYRSFLTPKKDYAIGGTPLNERPKAQLDEEEIVVIEQDSEDEKRFYKELQKNGIKLNAEHAYDEKLGKSAPANIDLVSKQLTQLQGHGDFRSLYGIENSDVDVSTREFVQQVRMSVAEIDRQIAEEKKRQQQEKEAERMREQLRYMHFNQRSSVSRSTVVHREGLFQAKAHRGPVAMPMTNAFKSGYNN